MRNNLKKAIIAISLCLIVFVGITAVDAALKINTSSNTASKRRVEKPKVRPRAMIPGETASDATIDVYIKTTETSSMDAKKLLQASGYRAHYSITGHEANHYEENANDPADIVTLLNKRVTLNSDDMAKLKSTTTAKHVMVRGTYYNEEIAALGMSGASSGTHEFKIPVSVVEEGVTAYNPDMATSALVAIHAENFDMSLDDAKDFTAAKAKSEPKAKLSAWDTAVAGGDFYGGILEPGKDLTGIVEVDAASVKAIKEAKVSGAYNLKYSAQYYFDDVQEKISKVYVTNGNTVIKDGVILFGNDISIDLKVAKTITSSQLKTKAGIKAFDYKYGTELDNNRITANVAALNAMNDEGKVQVPVQYKYGTTTIDTKITVYVTNFDNPVVDGDEYSLGANNVYVSEEQAKTLDKAAILTKSKAKAWQTAKPSVAGTVEVKEIDPTFQAKEGSYYAILNVKEEPKTEMRIKIIVKKGNIVVGKEYYITALPFKVGKNDANTMTDAQIIAKAQAEAFLKKDDSKANVEIDSKGGFTGVKGEYNITFRVKEEPATKITVKATVKDSDEYAEGDEYALEANHFKVAKGDVAALTNAQIISKSKAKAYKIEDESQAGTVQVIENNIKAAKGVYTVKLNVKEETKVVVTIKVTVTGKDIYVEGEEYALEANHITIGLDDAKSIRNSEILTKAQAEAYRLDNNSIKGSVQVDDRGGLTNVAGVYNVKISVVEEPATKATIKVTVKNKDVVVVGEKYTLEMNHFSIGVDDVAGMNDSKIIEKAKAVAYRNDDNSVAGTVQVDSGSLVAKEGTYPHVLSVVQEPATKGTINITVEKGHVVDGVNYRLRANDFIIGLKDAKDITDAKVIAKGKAKAYDRHTNVLKGTVLVSHNIDDKAGEYTVTYSVKEEPATKLVVKATVLDKENVFEGEEYVIGVNDFQINGKTAKTITNAEIISKAGAVAYKKPNLTTPAGTIKIAANTVKEAEGTYVVDYYVNEEPATRIDGNVTVNNGQGPKITVTSPVNIKVGDTFNAMDGVTVSDVEDDRDGKTLKVEYTKAFDVNVKGLYDITYTVEDSDGNTATAYRLLVVGDAVIGDEYVLQASNYDINKPDVKGTDAEIIKESKAVAKHKTTGKAGTVVVEDNGGYKAAEGRYTVKLGVSEDASAKKEIRVDVTDYINPPVTGDKYKIAADDFKIKENEVAGLTDQKVIDLSRAQAWDKEDFDKKGTVVVENRSIIKPVDGVYVIKLHVKEDPTAKTTIKVTVEDTTPPKFTIDLKGKDYILYYTEDFNPNKTEADFLDDIDASTDDGSTITSNFDNEKLKYMNAHVVTLKAQDASGNKAELDVKVVVIKKDQSVVGSKAVLKAEDFTLALRSARGLNATTVKGKDYAYVVAIDLKTGDEITTKVTPDPSQLNRIVAARAPGTYKLSFTITHEGETLKREIKVVITDR